MTGVGCTHGASTAGCGSLFGASAPGWRGGVLCVLQQRVINKVRVEHQPVSYSPCIFAVSISRVHTHFFSLQCWNQANWTEVLLGSIPRSQDARVTTRVIIYMGRQLGGIFLISRPSFSTRSTWYTCLGNRMESHSIYVYRFIYRHAYIRTLICHEPASWVRGVFIQLLLPVNRKITTRKQPTCTLDFTRTNVSEFLVKSLKLQWKSWRLDWQ